MILSKIRNNCKMCRITVIKLVIVFLLLVIFYDKLALSNIHKNLQNLSNANIETTFNNIINLGKVLSALNSVCITIGIVLCQFLMVAGFVHLLLIVANKSLFIDNVLSNNNFYNKYVEKKSYSHNDIYLTTNKFIC